jgi:hypothetical protein
MEKVTERKPEKQQKMISGSFVYMLQVKRQKPYCICKSEKICEEQLKGKYSIEVIDLLKIHSWEPLTRFLPCQHW